MKLSSLQEQQILSVLDEFLEGKQTPVFFGSAINNFGIENLLDGFIDMLRLLRDERVIQE